MPSYNKHFNCFMNFGFVGAAVAGLYCNADGKVRVLAKGVGVDEDKKCLAFVCWLIADELGFCFSSSLVISFVFCFFLYILIMFDCLLC